MFKTMKKEKNTDPEAELKLKKGGKTSKKMAMGGMPMAAGRGAPMVDPREAELRKAMAMKAMSQRQPGALMRKKGGEVESPKMHKSEMKEMGKIEKELKHHESMKASKAHKGLKTGGAPKKFAVGGATSNKIADRHVNDMEDGSNPKNKLGKTGGMKMPGYKNGGHVAMTCKNEGGYTQMKKMSKC
jgi:hypothetical protein